MDGKSLIGSKIFIAAVVMLLANLLQLGHYTFSPDDQAAMVNLIQSGITVTVTVISIVSGIVTIISRVFFATKPITSIMPKPAEGPTP